MKNAQWIRVAAVACALALAACGHGSSGPATVGVGIGVALSSPTGTTLVSAGNTIEIDAIVSNDTSGAGVTWALAGAGGIASQTATTVTYQAPSPVVGATFATLTATSVTDPTKTASVTLTVNGTPTILQPVLFPANQNVAYGTFLNAAGGTAPYTWSVSAGALPPGLALNGSTSATVLISGTPTTLGSFSFTLELTDSASLTASLPLTLVVNPQTACLLSGQFAYLFTGFYAELPVTRAGSFNVSSTGTISGIYDYKDYQSARPAIAVSSGTCQTLTQNRGQLHIASSTNGNENFDFGTQAQLTAGHLQQDDGTNIVGGGQFFQQDPTAFNQAALAGDWVFGMAGDDGAKNRLAVIGRLTLDASGNISNAVADNDAATPLAAAALTGTLTAPDANGRGTATLNAGGQSLPVAYYVVSSSLVLLVSSDMSATAPRLAGRMTRQAGAGTLDATALAGPAVLSMWGSSLAAGLPVATVTAGLLSAAAGGTITVELDVVDRGASLVNQSFAGSPYAIATNGRGTLTTGSGTATRNFVVYVDGAGGGYVLEPTSVVGNFGILDPQSGAPYTTFETAYYVGGTVYAGSTSPITLAPQLLFQSGSISGNINGAYALDPVTGRMVASADRTILGGSGLVIWIVSPNKLVVIGDGVDSVNSSLAWFVSY